MTRNNSKAKAGTTRDLVLAILPELVVKQNGRIEVSLAPFDPLIEHLQRRFSGYLREDYRHVYTFIVFNDRIQVAQSEIESRKLIDVIGEAEIQELANTICGFWDSLPLTYELLFPLPLLKWSEESAQLAPGITLGKVSRLLALNDTNISYTLTGVLGLDRMPRPTVACLTVECHGLMYMGDAAEVPAAYAIRRAKIFFELAKVLGIFTSGSPSIDNIVVANYHIRPSSGSGDGRVNLPRTFANALGRLMLMRPDNAIALQFASQFASIRSVLNHEEEWNRSRLTRGKKALTPNDVINRHCARIATAAEWLFDASYDDNSIMTFVQTAIGFETLYGGQDSESITSTLSNRVSYSLAQSPEEREALRKEFNDFYATRSKVVHNGSTSLSGSESRRLIQGQRTLRRALRHEMSLLAPKGALSRLLDEN